MKLTVIFIWVHSIHAKFEVVTWITYKVHNSGYLNVTILFERLLPGWIMTKSAEFSSQIEKPRRFAAIDANRSETRSRLFCSSNWAVSRCIICITRTRSILKSVRYNCRLRYTIENRIEIGGADAVAVDLLWFFLAENSVHVDWAYQSAIERLFQMYLTWQLLTERYLESTSPQISQE